MDNTDHLALSYVDLISSLRDKTGLDISLKQCDIQVVPSSTLERMFNYSNGKTAGTLTVSIYFSGDRVKKL